MKSKLILVLLAMAMVGLGSCKKPDKKSNDTTVSSVMIDGITANVSGTTYTVALCKGSAVTSLTPTITLKDGKATYSPKGAQNFTNSVTYTITAEDGTTKSITIVVTATTVCN